MKRLRLRRAKKRGKKSEMNADREHVTMDEALIDVTADELREFLEADAIGVRADPTFKERLRRQLWELVRSRVQTDAPERDET